MAYILKMFSTASWKKFCSFFEVWWGPFFFLDFLKRALMDDISWNGATLTAIRDEMTISNNVLGQWRWFEIQLGRTTITSDVHVFWTLCALDTAEACTCPRLLMKLWNLRPGAVTRWYGVKSRTSVQTKSSFATRYGCYVPLSGLRKQGNIWQWWIGDQLDDYEVNHDVRLYLQLYE